MSEQAYTPGDFVQVLYSAKHAPKRVRGNFYRVVHSWGGCLILEGPRGGRVEVAIQEVIPIAAQAEAVKP